MLSTLVSSVTYNGNDATTSFDYPFKIWEASNLEVWITNAAGAESQISTNFTVYGIGDAAGGNIVYPTTGSPLVTGYKITLRRILPVSQAFYDAVNNQAFYAEILEENFDRTVAMIQQLDEVLDRSFRASLSSDISPDLPLAEAGKVLAWNSAEDALENISVSAGSIPAGSINTVDISDDAITLAKMADNSVDTAEIVDDAVTTVKILNANVTEAKLATAAKGVLVSANDTTIGYLNGKLVAGTGIMLTEGNDGANESLTVASVSRSYLYHSDLTDQQVAGAVVETDMNSFILTGGDLAVGDCLRINTIIYATNVQGTSAIEIKFYLGATAVTFGAQFTADAEFFTATIDIWNVGTSSQRLNITYALDAQDTVGTHRNIYTTMSEDTSGNLTAKFTVTPDDVLDDLVQRILSAEIIRG